MKVRSFASIGGCAAAFTLIASAASASCSINNGGPYTSPIPASGKTLPADYSLSNLCGKSITAPSGTCVVNVSTSQIASSTQATAGADCLTLGPGVTVNFLTGDSKILCSHASGCGKGINVTNSGGSSSKVEVNGAYVEGQFTTAIYGTTGTNFIVNDATVDGQGVGTDGIAHAVNEVNSSRVTDLTDDCIDIGINPVTDTSVSYCGDYCVNSANAGGANHTVIKYSVLHHCGKAMNTDVDSTSDVELLNSVLYDNTCNFWTQFYNFCSSTPSGIDVSSHSFVDDIFFP